ncbi:hypothetical protein, partial [Nocardia cyriacigeorgica]|uniref:hypothetical protein n=1 Tax=Nocardia cyriacigeorgica TaxID=135487 RepID=UPI001E3AB113
MGGPVARRLTRQRGGLAAGVAPWQPGAGPTRSLIGPVTGWRRGGSANRGPSIPQPGGVAAQRVAGAATRSLVGP